MEGPHLHGQQLQGRRAGKSTQNPRAPAGPHLCVLVPLLTWRVLDTHSPFQRTGLPRTHTDLGPGPSPQPGGHLPLPQGSPSSRAAPGFLERTTAPRQLLSSVLLSLWVFAPLAPLPRAPPLPALHLGYCSLLSEETRSAPRGVLGPPLLTTGTRHTAEVPSVFVCLGGLRPPRNRSPPSPEGPSIVQCSAWPRAGGQEKTLNGEEWCFSPSRE